MGLYRGQCSNCSYQTAEMLAYRTKFRLDSGEFVPLRVPMSSIHLRELGYTYDEAYKQSRLVRVMRVVCDGCGDIAEKYSLAVDSPVSCCVFGLTVPILLMLLAMELLRGPVYVKESVGILLAVIAATLYRFMLKVIGKRRQRKYAIVLPTLLECPHCSCRKFTPLERCRKSICPECRHRSLRYIQVRKII